MPWMPVGRAGYAGDNFGRAGMCKYMQTPPELMLGAPIHVWVHLVEVLGGEKTYSGSTLIIKIYPALSLAIGGRDGMDGGGAHWMTHSNYSTRHQSLALLALACCWAHLAGVSGGEKL